MTDVIAVLVTFPSPDKAAEVGRLLVDEKIAACANIIPGIRSIYRWQDKVCDEPEVLMVLKTRRELFEVLKARVLAVHPYECPEVLQLELSDGHGPYLDWVLANVRPI